MASDQQNPTRSLPASLHVYLAKKVECLKIVQNKGNKYINTLLAFDALLQTVFHQKHNTPQQPAQHNLVCNDTASVDTNKAVTVVGSQKDIVSKVITRDCIIKTINPELLEQLVIATHNARPLYKGTNTRIRNWHLGEIVGLVELLVWDFQTASRTLPPCMEVRSAHVEEIITFQDGGCSCLHIFYPPALLINDVSQNKLRQFPILLISPSLTSTHASYYKLIQHYVVGKQWTVVVTNRRGLCCTLRTPLFCVMGDDEDMCAMLRRIQELPLLKGRTIFGLGVSVGGNALSRYCAKYTSGSETDKIAAIATISSPFNLSDLNCKSGAIQYELLDSLKKIFLKGKNQSVFDASTTDVQSIYRRLLRCQSLAQFAYQQLQFRYELGPNGDAFVPLTEMGNVSLDETVSVVGTNAIAKKSQPILKHASTQSYKYKDPTSMSLWDYYNTYNADKYFHTLQIPLICIIAADDPLIRHSVDTRANLFSCNNVGWIQTEAGSHVLFQDDLLKTNTDLTWAECFIETYFDKLLTKIVHST